MGKPRPLSRKPRSGRCTWHAGLWPLLLGLCACAPTQVLVNASFPEPVLQKLPATVGLYLPPTLVHRVHSETLPGGSKWRIDLGAANAALFTRVFTGMFKNLLTLKQPSGGGLDLIIQPQMQDFQFSTPDQSKTQFYEAWIKYRLQFTTAGGKTVADLPISAYGRSRKRFLHGGDALADAARRAMRDAAAAIVVKLPRDAAVQAYLHGTAAVASGHASPAGDNNDASN